MADVVREGDLYKIVKIAGRCFEIRYGYISDGERAIWDPAPIYPDFLEAPQYTPEGYPFATAYQDICAHFTPKTRVSGENWCADCTFFNKQEECIGICESERRKENPTL